MKFLNISDTKLKVTLTADDCISYGIDLSKDDYSTREVRDTMRKIFLRAEEECGFSVSSDKVLVQIYPLPDGNCELLVTKLGTLSRKDRDTITSTDGLSLLEHKRGTYRFYSAGDLILAVRAVYRTGVDADLYRDDLGRYYIQVDEEIADGISELEIFVEYGERLSSLPIAVISEYGTLLAKGNAFEYVLSGGLESYDRPDRC